VACSRRILTHRVWPRAACLLSIVGVASYSWCFVFVPSFSLRAEVMWALYLGAVVGIVFGCIAFLIVECGFRVVDWADNLMRSKSDD
jgi:hypothetical protein